MARAAANIATGSCQRVPAGPRLSASYPTTSRVSSRTIGWNAVQIARSSMTCATETVGLSPREATSA
jgi:hypothetical protein